PTLPSFPNNDNLTLTIPVAAFGACSAPFFQTAFTQVMVTDNGCMTFGGGVAPTPYVASALSAPGKFGVWCDLWAPTGGINVTSPYPGALRLSFSSVRYYLTGNLNSFSLTLDSANGVLSIENVAGITANSVYPSSNQFVGISRGLGATDPGQTDFSGSIGLGPQPGPGGTAMIYRFGPEGTLAPGVTSITFTPNGTGNYNFIVY
ncbi:MAG TPA: hypothetical protein VIW26_07530, partial [Gemmatimonadales bacterium]